MIENKLNSGIFKQYICESWCLGLISMFLPKINFMQWCNLILPVKIFLMLLVYMKSSSFLPEWRKKREEHELGREKDLNKIQVSSYQMYQGSCIVCN